MRTIKSYTILLLLAAMAFISCGPDSNHVRIQGHLLNLNQGEFLVYSPDGTSPRIDTITVNGGRFDYEGPCHAAGTMAIVMPNGTEIAVFAKPGKSFSVEGDATHLRQVKVKGSDENKLMNEFRDKTAQINESALGKSVEEFVTSNPLSHVSLYLIRRYLLHPQKPDYKKAEQLLRLMVGKDTGNAAAQMLLSAVSEMKVATASSAMPTFTATDIYGKSVSNTQFLTDIAVVMSFATFDYESLSQIRRVYDAGEGSQKRPKILAVSLDASKKQCKDMLRSDSTHFTTICEEKMADGNVAHKFAFMQPGQTIIYRNGRVIASNLTGDKLTDKLKTLR